MLTPCPHWALLNSSSPSCLGLFNLVLFSPGLALHSTQQVLGHLSLGVLLTLIGKGLLDNVLSDYMWARAVLMTKSATVATIGLSLTIPLSMAVDFVLNQKSPWAIEAIGALLVLSAFVMVGYSGSAAASATRD
jgi:solute carrier family 35 protein F5